MNFNVSVSPSGSRPPPFTGHPGIHRGLIPCGCPRPLPRFSPQPDYPHPPPGSGVARWRALCISWTRVPDRGGHYVFACPSPPRSVCSEAGSVSLISTLLQLALRPSEGRSLWKGGRRGNRQVGLPSGLPCSLPSHPSAPWTFHSLMSSFAGGMVWLPE